MFSVRSTIGSRTNEKTALKFELMMMIMIDMHIIGQTCRADDNTIGSYEPANK